MKQRSVPTLLLASSEVIVSSVFGLFLLIAATCNVDNEGLKNCRNPGEKVCWKILFNLYMSLPNEELNPA